MLYEFVNGPSETTLAKWNDSTETFVFDRTHEPLGMRVRVRCAERRAHHLNPCTLQEVLDGPIPLAGTVTNQYASTHQDPVIRDRRRGRPDA